MKFNSRCEQGDLKMYYTEENKYTCADHEQQSFYVHIMSPKDFPEQAFLVTFLHLFFHGCQWHLGSLLFFKEAGSHSAAMWDLIILQQQEKTFEFKCQNFHHSRDTIS